MSDQFILDEGNQFILFDGLQAQAQTTFSAPLLNTFVKVVLTIKNIETGGTTDLPFINREIISDLNYYPLLRGVSTLGAKMRDYLPEISRSSITLDNSPNSFGSERKFSDLLDRFTLIEQKAVISIAQIALGNDNIQDGDFTEQWRAIVTDINFVGDSIKIGLSRAIIPVRLGTKIVDKTSFPSAPQDSLGKQLPIVFSDTGEYIEVQPVMTSSMYDANSGTENRLDFAYATTFANTFLPSGTGSDAVQLFADNQDKDRTYEALAFATNPSTPIWNLPVQAVSYLNTWAVVKEYGYQLKAGQNVTGGEIFVGANWFLASTTYSLTPPTGTYSYTLKVYSSNNGFPGILLASETLESGSSRISYDSSLAGGTISVYKFDFRLNKPIQIPVDGSVFVTMSRNDSGNKFSLLQEGTAPGSLPSFEKYIITDTTSGTDQNFVRNVVTHARDHLQIYAVAKTEDLTGGSSSAYQNGLGHVSFTLAMRDQDNTPDLTKLRLLAKTQGLRDNSSGTITGVANSRLSNPLHQVRLLMMDWNGSAWVESAFNATKFSSTHADAFGSSSRWNIKTAGATQGRGRIRDIIEDICRNGNCRLVPYVSGNANVVGLYAQGSKITPSFAIDDENAKLLNVEISGVETIVNKIQIVFNRTFQTRLESLLADGGLNNYQNIVSSDTDSFDVPYDLVARSISTWGERPLDNITYGWITQTQTAKSVASLLLRRFNAPAWMIEVEVPFNKYSNIGCMDVGILKMASLPDYFGTSLDARLPTAGTDANTVDLIKGHYWKRYKSYRVQVESNSIVFSNSEPLKRVLTLKTIAPIEIA